MSEKGTSLARFVEHFGLEILNKGDTYDTDRIESTNINRPDLQILGLFDYFDARRIQVMGKAELTYIMKMSETRRAKVFDDLFSYTIPAFVWRATLNAHRSVWNMLKITAGRFFGQRSGLRFHQSCYGISQQRVGPLHYAARCSAGHLRRGCYDYRRFRRWQKRGGH